jgi:hypothetical protein
MPMYDRVCTKCETQLIDCWEPITAPIVECPKCHSATDRAWLAKPSNVIGDDIPGGVWVRHGLCDPVTGEPRKYYSRSEIAAEAKRRGLVNLVEHIPEQGSDKARHTTRWV